MIRATSTSSGRKRLLALAAVAPLAVLTAACSGNGAAALGHQSCVDVSHALALYRAGASASDPAVKKRDDAQSLVGLRAALRPAALAAGEDGDWQALEATLSETSRVAEANLVTALQSQCAATLAG